MTAEDGDVRGIVNAVIKLADDKQFYSKCVKNIEQAAEDYTWEKICQPIIDFCRDPVSSALKDRKYGGVNSSVNNGLSTKKTKTSGKGGSYLIKRFFYHFFRSGPRQTSRFISNYLKGR